MKRSCVCENAGKCPGSLYQLIDCQDQKKPDHITALTLINRISCRNVMLKYKYHYTDSGVSLVS